jgi:hypothetical protein
MDVTVLAVVIRGPSSPGLKASSDIRAGSEAVVACPAGCAPPGTSLIPGLVWHRDGGPCGLEGRLLGREYNDPTSS